MNEPKCRCWNPARQHDVDCPVHGQFGRQPEPEEPEPDFPDWEMGGEG